ncbi:MAG: hypothetical protein AAGB48_06485 [Planctomycetota bacterium]
MPADPATTLDASGLRRPLLLIMAVLLAASIAGSIGLGPDAGAGVTAVLYVVLTAGFPAALYLLAAIGIGRPLTRALLPGSPAPWATAAGLGLGAMLLITLVMGQLGMLSRAGSLVPIALGIALLVQGLPELITNARTDRGPSPWWLLTLPAVAALLAAASSPPGWLWESEFAGYDALSYHLQLPREWHATGRVWPVDHNVYSYLPSAVEAAFVHIAALTGTPKDRFITDDGSLPMACQLLHAGITLIAAWIVAATGRQLAERASLPERAALVGFVAGGLTLATPWAVVTGSMAYNEMAVVALLSGAILAAASSADHPIRTGLAVGALVGAACACKPTAIMIGGPVAGLMLLAAVPMKRWPVALAAATIAGAATIAPWLVRNWLASGNPVFPMLTSVFGTAHWTTEQAQRYHDGHAFDGSILDALRLLVVADPTDPAASESAGIHRGLMHAQWALLGPLLPIAAALALLRRAARRWAITLLAGTTLSIAAWATLTHVQSRFLIPLLPAMVLLVGLGIGAAAAGWPKARGMRVALPWIARGLVTLTAAMTLWIFSQQRTQLGGPNAVLPFGTAAFINPAIVGDDVNTMPAEMWIRSQLPEGSKTLLVGDARPFYMPQGTLYTTTWDTSPVASALRAWTDDPDAALLELQSIVSHIYIDGFELDRLQATGWADPLMTSERVGSFLAHKASLLHTFAGQPRAVFALEHTHGTGPTP